jgi:hypothetical protein
LNHRAAEITEKRSTHRSSLITHHLYILLTVALLLVAFWLRLENLDTLPTGLSNDEATSVIDAFHITRIGSYPFYEDHGRPEPLDRYIMALGIHLYGSSIWAFRLTNVFAGLLTVAIAYWTMQESIYDANPNIRRIAALAAAAALAVAISHITLSRAIYRAIFQPPFMLLVMGLLLRGLRTERRRYFVWSGVCLALTLYTYTSALAVPVALLPVALNLLIFRRKRWRNWLPNLALLGMVFAVLMLPVGWRLATNPQSVLGRSAEVNRGTGFNLSPEAVNGVIAQFFSRGDINPQYNVERAPLLPRSFVGLFVAGLLAVLVRVRQPSSWLIASLLVLMTVPVIAGSEIPHGLRVMGEFAVFPLVIGLGIALIIMFIQRLVEIIIRTRHGVSLRAALNIATLAALIFITWQDAVYARQTYSAYWSNTEGYEHTWRIFGRVLPIADWFFRPDRRDFARWLTLQDAPMLVPLEELSTQTTRAWLLTAYPNVVARGDDAVIPPGTRLLVPWSLELDGLRSETRHYALLNDNTITLLPPLSAETHAALLENIEQGEPITRTGVLDFMGYIKEVPAGEAIRFEAKALESSDSGPGLGVFDNEVRVVGWRGPDTLAEAGAFTYTLDWQALRHLGHDYSTFLQLQTQDYQRIAGDEDWLWRWLFPSTQWRTNDIVPDVQTLEIPADLPPGAYRLVAGVYVSTFVDERLPATTGLDTSLGDAATIGWVKVPQPGMPSLEEAAILLDATLADTFALRRASAAITENSQLYLRLYWQSLVNRPAIDATIFVHIVNQSGEIVAQQDARPWGGQYPTFIWDDRELVETDYAMDIGAADRSGLTVRVGMYTFPDLARLPVIQNGEPVPDAFVDVDSLEALLQR